MVKMKNDLISRSALLEKATNVTKYDEGGWDMDLRAVPVDAVENAPTIEAEPVRHGRWVNMLIAKIDTTGDCTNCGQEAVWRTRNKPYAVCPNCGAKMQGGSDE